MSSLTFVPFEYPQSDDGEFCALLAEHGMLQTRREQLGLTQRQVADMAGINVSQYQRFEAGEKYISGTSMRIGLAVCAVLMLDPYELIGINVSQPDPKNMKPVPLFSSGLLKDLLVPKRVGRKNIRKEITTVYVNYDEYSFLISYDILKKIGCPEYIQTQWNIEKRQIVFRSADKAEEGAFDVPEQIFDKSYYALPSIKAKKNPIAAMNWGDTPYAVEARLVKDSKGTIYIMVDLNTGKVADTRQIEGAFITPKRLSK